MRPQPLAKVVIVGVIGAGLVAAWLFRAPGPRLISRVIGVPAPASARDIRYRSDEWLGLGPEPVYYLRFRADPEEVRAMLEAGGFRQADAESGFWPAAEISWWVPESVGTNLVRFSRASNPGGCVIEMLCWDSSTGDVFYHRSCP